MPDLFCRICGTPAANADRFCRKCGSALSTATAGEGRAQPAGGTPSPGRALTAAVIIILSLTFLALALVLVSTLGRQPSASSAFRFDLPGTSTLYPTATPYGESYQGVDWLTGAGVASGPVVG